LRKLKQLKMEKLVMSNPKLLHMYKLCRALPLLPADRIEEAFTAIADLDATKEMKPFLIYIEKQWIKLGIIKN
jgi:hypothetical protein